MWGVRTGVLRSDSLNIVTYRCQETFDNMDVLLLYNCNMVTGHYTGILRGRGVLECKKVDESEGFDFDGDV